MNRLARIGFGKPILLALFSILALTRLTCGAEDVPFFEKRYQTKISGVKPIGEYDDPDKFYAKIGKQLGIPRLAMEAAAAEFGWKEDDGKLTAGMVGRTPGQWQVMISRIAVFPDTKRPNPATIEVKAGQFVADPPKPVNTPDGKLHFSIQQGDVLVKVGDPARHFTLLQLRNIGGQWRVVAESKP